MHEMQKAAQRALERWGAAERAFVVGLSGDLGAGKTTFVQVLAKELGVHETITSPTFVIQKTYPLKQQKFARLVHIDAYRLTNTDELEALGFRALRDDPGNLIVVEWPERVSEILGEDERITFVWVDETTRTVAYEAA